MIRIIQNPSVALIENGIALSPEQTESLVRETVCSIADPRALPVNMFDKAGRDCSVGFSLNDGKHLTPTFNFAAVPSLQCEFTNALKAKGFGFVELSKKHVKALHSFSKASEMTPLSGTGESFLDVLKPFSTLSVGSVGSRSTNHAMAYEIEIDFIPTKQIKSLLEMAGIELVNKDKRNIGRAFGLSLTCKSEVEAFVEAANAVELYLDIIRKVEDYQADHELKNAYNENGERLEDYKAKSIKMKAKLNDDVALAA